MLKHTITLLAGSLLAVAATAQAPAYPARPVTLIVPFANTPAQFAQLIDNDRKRYAQIIRDRKISVD